MIDDISKLLSKWLTGKRSGKIMQVVVEAMTEARQKVRSSDSPFKSLARKCIDKAEDAYQEAIYQLKDGDPQLCFQYCKQGLKFLSIAMLHLSELNGRVTEPVFENDTAEQAAIDLSLAIARFKTSVEYTNAEVPGDVKERLHDVVRMLAETIECVRDDDDEGAVRTARAGLLWMHFLGTEMDDKLRTAVVDVETLDRIEGSAPTRIISLIDELSETRRLLSDTHQVAHGRIKTYLDAARRTIEQCLSSYADGDTDDVSQRSKAGSMELRMAKRLIEYARYPGSGPEPEDEELEEEDESAYEFKRRVVRLQRLLKERDEDDEQVAGVVRRLYVVSTYYARARNLLDNGDFTEAERLARSAHLDIDFARQLLIDKHATYSDLI